MRDILRPILTALIVLVTACYLVFVCIPAYQSGIGQYTEQQILNEVSLDIPGFTFNPVNAAGNWRAVAALFSGLAAYSIVPFCFVLICLSLLGKRTIQRINPGYLLTISGACLLFMVATSHQAGLLLTWLAD